MFRRANALIQDLAEDSPSGNTPPQNGEWFRGHRRTAAVVRTARPLWLALFFSAVLLGIMSTLEFDPLALLVPMVLQVVLAVVLFGVGGVWLTRGRWRGWAPDTAVAALGAYIALTLATVLHATPYPLGGLSADAGFRVAAVTRFAESAGYGDMFYTDLPAFYPSTLLFLTGRVADVFAIPSHAAFKGLTVLGAGLAPVLGYLFWRRVVSDRAAALAGLASLLPIFGTLMGAKPNEWLVVVCIVPWWIDAVFDVRRADRQRLPIIWHGVIGAALFSTFYYFFFPLTVSLLLVPWLDRLTSGRRRDLWLRRLGILAVAALLSSWYWGPLLSSVIQSPHTQFVQNRSLRPANVNLPLPIAVDSILKVALAVGFVCVVSWAFRDRICRALVVVIAGAYLWYLIGFVAAAADHPVLADKTGVLIHTTLVAAAALTATNLGSRLWRRFPARGGRVAIATAGLVLVFAVAQAFTLTTAGSGFVKGAHSTPLPNGALPRYHPQEAQYDNGASADRIAATIARLYDGRRPPVVATSYWQLMVLQPYTAFKNPGPPVYAHPAAGYATRLALLTRLSRTLDPATFAAMAQRNNIAGIDAFVLETTGQPLSMTGAIDDFPNSARGKHVRLHFERVQFDPQVWSTVDVKGYFVAVRR